jgi:hypothetical protein
MKANTTFPQNIEAFHMNASDFQHADDSTWMHDAMENAGVDWDDPESVAFEAKHLAGIYYWFCYPGCLPDSDAFGPFPSMELAIAHAWEEFPSDEDNE